MKHLPNLLTLANLLCGCIATAYILTAQPYLSMTVGHAGLPAWQWIYGSNQMYLGSFFIVIAAVCDLLDGFVARALKVFSPIGKDLDSLADVVSFGVAPSAILFRLLWDTMAAEKNAFDVNMLGLAPAFLLACFAALRLAKFNISADTQRSFFVGMPTPAVGLFVATFPLLMWFSPPVISGYFGMFIQHKWNIYLLIGVLCWLMVSKIRFLKMAPAGGGIKNMWPQILLLVIAVGGIFVIGFAALPVVFVLYVLLSLVYRYPQTENA